MLSALRYQTVNRRTPVAATLVVAIGLGSTGCAGSTGATSAAKPDAAVPIARTCRAGAYRRYGTPRLAYAAIVRSTAVARRTPGGPVLGRFGRLNQNGVPTVFSVRGARLGPRCVPTWFRVQLPIRPNGVTGWVRAGDVDMATVKTRIDVDVSARRLTLFRSGKAVLRATVAVGSPATPTPLGHYYVNQRLIPDDPSGPFGPGAVGISAYSNVLTGWVQGGPIAIHGTNEPWSIGHAVSNGCIRLPNSTLRRVFAAAFNGTPVVIHA
ncbi:MAG: L,D-transpeptidase [Actinobacteria bacterium]|nr:MAG: L,D-transpeptidase [Actinomycetota bacterium]